MKSNNKGLVQCARPFKIEMAFLVEANLVVTSIVLVSIS